MAKPSNELIVVEKIAAGEVFTSSDKVEALLKSVEEQALAIPADVTTEKGRAAIASLAHKVARSKTALEEMGKEFAGVVAESRRTIKDRLDALKVKVRQPLTDWEYADEKRRDAHEGALSEIAENGVVLMPAPSRVIQARIDWLTELPARDWEEFAERAEVLIKATGQALLIHLAAAVHLETERAELDRLRQEAAERAEKERHDAEVKRAVERIQAHAAEQEKADLVAAYSVPFEAERVTIPLTAPSEVAPDYRRDAGGKDQELLEAEDALQTVAGLSFNSAVDVLDAIIAGKIPHIRIIY